MKCQEISCYNSKNPGILIENLSQCYSYAYITVLAVIIVAAN
jgi:hypothetical protein